MKLAYFDCQFGAAGDMLLGAFLNAGLPQPGWLQQISKIALPPESYSLSIKDTVRSGIAATKVDVDCHEHGVERHLSDILQIIDKSSIAPEAQQLSAKIFGRLAEAEAKVHGLSTDEVHFHEVGAVDAIIDIIGFAIAYHMSGIDTAHASALALGSGSTKMEHGVFPVPGPAVVNLMSDAGAPVRESAIDFECLT